MALIRDLKVMARGLPPPENCSAVNSEKTTASTYAYF
jgi:hypothetical protein